MIPCNALQLICFIYAAGGHYDDTVLTVPTTVGRNGTFLIGQNNGPSNLGTVGIPAADAGPVVNYRNYIALAVPYNDLFYSDTSGCDPDDGITFKFDRERPPPDANGILNLLLGQHGSSRPSSTQTMTGMAVLMTQMSQ